MSEQLLAAALVGFVAGVYACSLMHLKAFDEVTWEAIHDGHMPLLLVVPVIVTLPWWLEAELQRAGSEIPADADEVSEA